MTINEEARQSDIAAELQELSRTLAHSTRAVPKPSESYRLLGELSSTVTDLAQVVNQIAQWHNQVEDGVHYDGEDGGRTGSPKLASSELLVAASSLILAAEHISRAHSHNAVVRWYETAQR